MAGLARLQDLNNMLSPELKSQIKEYALQNPNVELCGLVVSSGDSTFIYKCKNISQNSGKHFELSPFDYLRAYDEGRNKIVGFFHSQKSVKPSTLDIVNYRNHKIPSYIYSHESDEVFEVTDKHLKYNKYLGREFEIGKNDCFSLVREFYKNEKNISIFDYPRKDNWYKDSPEIIKSNYKKEGFIIIDLNDIINGDIVEFFNFHFAIYLDGDFLLHHERNRHSNIEYFSDIWKKRITNVYRHEK
jgi:proteasome lid subunit RPN8/RPN11